MPITAIHATIIPIIVKILIVLLLDDKKTDVGPSAPPIIFISI
jgi:hypothetical protein